MRRRLFQRFQQRIKAVAGKHVHFVDQIDFETTTRRRVLNVIQQIAGIFDFGSRGGVDLQQINKTALLNLTAIITHAAWR